MNPSQLRGDLPEPVRRYFLEVAQMQPPADLLDAAVAEIERTTPRINRFGALPVFGFVAAAALVIALLVYTFMTPLAPSVGDEASARPSASEAAASATPEPTLVPVATLAPLEGLPEAADVVATHDVGSAGVPVLYAHGSVWLANAATGTLSRMDPDTGELTGSVEVNPDPDHDRYDLNAVADDRWVWATGLDDTVVKIDPQTDAVVERIPIGTIVYRMVLHDGELWVTDLDQGGRVIRIDTETSDILADERYPEWPAALAVTDSDVWMAPYRGDLLYRLDRQTAQRLEIFPTSEFSMQMIGFGDALYISGNQERPLERFSTTDLAVTARVPEMNLATDGERLFGLRYDGAFMELDPETLQPRSASTIDGGETSIGVFAAGRFYVAQGEADPQIVVLDPHD